MKNKLIIIIFVLVLVGLSVVGGAFGGAGVMYFALTNGLLGPVDGMALAAESESATDGEQPSRLVVSTTEMETAITNTVAGVGPAVVTVVGRVLTQRDFFGYSSESQVSGSGVIISEQGYILTNNHVVEDATQLMVVLANGEEQEAVLVGSDRFADIAILKTEGSIPAIASLGNSDTLSAGETVIAIGSPLGDLKNTVTVGVISATGRNLDSGRGYQLNDMIQTDAAINQGNSGGPLVNLAGEVIGINTLVVRGSGSSSTSAEGLGFAVPANTARAIADQIIQTGYFARPYLGIRYQSITPDIASIYGLPVDWGVYVAQLDRESPAAQAGLQRGDIITRIGDQTLDDNHPYINALFAYSPGQTIQLEIVRSGEVLTLPVTLGESK